MSSAQLPSDPGAHGVSTVHRVSRPRGRASRPSRRGGLHATGTAARATRPGVGCRRGARRRGDDGRRGGAGWERRSAPQVEELTEGRGQLGPGSRALRRPVDDGQERSGGHAVREQVAGGARAGCAGPSCPGWPTTTTRSAAATWSAPWCCAPRRRRTRWRARPRRRDRRRRRPRGRLRRSPSSAGGEGTRSHRGPVAVAPQAEEQVVAAIGDAPRDGARTSSTVGVPARWASVSSITPGNDIGGIRGASLAPRPGPGRPGTRASWFRGSAASPWASAIAATVDRPAPPAPVTATSRPGTRRDGGSDADGRGSRRARSMGVATWRAPAGGASRSNVAGSTADSPEVAPRPPPATSAVDDDHRAAGVLRQPDQVAVDAHHARRPRAGPSSCGRCGGGRAPPRSTSP